MDFSDESDDLDELNKLAWYECVRFVQGQIGGDESLNGVLTLAANIELRQPLWPWHMNRSFREWAMALLVVRYGGHKNFQRAWRGYTTGLTAPVYLHTPQLTSLVQFHPQANAVVFAAELRAEYLRLSKLLLRHGKERVRDIDTLVKATTINWAISTKESFSATLYWRELSLHRFASSINRLLRRDVSAQTGSAC